MWREIPIVDPFMYYRIWVMSPKDITTYCGFGNIIVDLIKKADLVNVKVGFFEYLMGLV